MKKEHAKRMLGDVAPEQCFWVNRGPIVKNIRQLPTALKRMKEETFMHHVNTGKNDFSEWIKHVVGDAALASKVSKLKTKKAMIDEINKRVKLLKKTAG
ncbi:hypothetical protein KY361_04825 [Candidatus Woesearchaeota archaeon]|nr:hypothetical protein [Candidatus Woesearchaeota archaeon]